MQPVKSLNIVVVLLAVLKFMLYMVEENEERKQLAAADLDNIQRILK